MIFILESSLDAAKLDVRLWSFTRSLEENIASKAYSDSRTMIFHAFVFAFSLAMLKNLPIYFVCSVHVNTVTIVLKSVIEQSSSDSSPSFWKACLDEMQ